MSNPSVRQYCQDSQYGNFASATTPLQVSRVERPRLVDPLLANIARKAVTFIHGAAGSGKSVLIEQAMQSLEGRVRTTLFSLMTHTLHPSPHQSALQCIAQRAADLARQHGELVVFVDDADALVSLDGQGPFESCLEGLAPRCTWVFASRRRLDPRTLGDHASGGGSLCIGQLMFTAAELRVALNRTRGPIAAATHRAIWRGTGGWPALVSLFCASEASNGTLSAQELLFDWFEDELFTRLRPEVMRFVLEASTVGVWSAPLLNQVCGRSDSHVHMKALVDEYGVELDQHGELPRPLSMALARLHTARAPQRAAQLHRQTLGLQLERQHTLAALDHACQLGDKALLAQLLEAHGQSLLTQGYMLALRRWLGMLDRSRMLGESVQLQLMLAWTMLFTNDHEGARTLVRTLRRMPRSSVFDASLSSLELTGLSMRDGLAVYQAAEVPALAVNTGHPFALGVMYCTQAFMQLVNGDIGGAEERLAGAMRDETFITGPFVDAYARSIMATACLIRGEASDAHQHLLKGRADIPDAGGLFCGNSLLGTLEAMTLYESGRCAEARMLLELHLPLLQQSGLLDPIMVAHKVYTRIVLQDDDGALAQETLAALECLGRDRSIARMVFCARLERVRCALVRGDVALAASLLESARDLKMELLTQRCVFLASDTDTFTLMAARVTLAQGGNATLVGVLGQELEAAIQAKRYRRALTVRLLLAWALEQQGHEHAARVSMAAALTFAADHGLKQALRDEGRAVLTLAHKTCNSHPELRGFVDELLLDTKLALNAVVQPRLDAHSSLTAKELRLLAMLAGGHSNDALAQALFVSQSTVRTHLRNINAKLNARSRLEALAIARRTGLITA